MFNAPGRARGRAKNELGTAFLGFKINAKIFLAARVGPPRTLKTIDELRQSGLYSR
jgi:hypothetical protein